MEPIARPLFLTKIEAMKIAISFLAAASFALSASCLMANEAEPSSADACSLLTLEEIQKVQNDAIESTQPSTPVGGDFSMSQCYFQAHTPSNSVIITVTRKKSSPDAADPREAWKQMFEEEERGEREVGEEKPSPPQKITGVGEQSFWLGDKYGGALYALKGSAYLSISVGGAGDPASKMERSKQLAQIALTRL